MEGADKVSKPMHPHSSGDHQLPKPEMHLLCNLTQVEIISCQNLRCIFSSPALATSMKKLEILRIRYCDDLEEIISGTDVDEGGEIHSFGNEANGECFPQLKELEVTGCGMITGFASHGLVFGNRMELCLLNEFVTSPVGLTKMQIDGCRKLTSLFSVLVAQRMVQLKVLKISKCNELKEMISVSYEVQELEVTKNEVHGACFPQLEELEVTECERISSFLLPAFVARGLAQLQELKVSKLPKLKHVFGDQKEEVDWHGRDFWLPLLTKLKLKELPNLISLWERDRISSSWLSKDWDSLFLQYQPMQVLEVSGCPKFSTYFVANRQSQLQAQAAKQLRSIDLNNLQGRDFIMQLPREDENHQLLSFYLLGLCLRDVADIEFIWSGSPQDINMCFSSLKYITVTDCGGLKQVFPTPIAKSLMQLECLAIMRCNELEYVTIDEGLEDESEDGQLKSLRILKIIQCEKLKTIFSLPVTQNHVPNLEELHLKSNPELLNIFSHGMVNVKNQDSVIDVNALHLPPSTLKVLVVSGCPKISSQFLPQLNNQLQAPAKLTTISLEKIKGVEEVIQLQRKDMDKSLTFDLLWLNLYDLQDLKCVWKGPAKNVYFSNLDAVVVKRCNELKQLFTTNIARSMLKLRFLTVEQCSKIEQVVIVDQDDDAVNNNITVLFPELEWLRLKDLPELVSFCPSPTYQLKSKSHFKRHYWLKVEGCPKAKDIKEFFSGQQNTEIEEATEEKEINATITKW